MIELLVASLCDRGVPTEVPLVEWPDIVVLVGDEAVHRHHVVHDYRAHSFSLSLLAHSPPILSPPGTSGLVKSQSAGIGTLSGGNPCSAGNRRRRARYSVGVWPVKSLNSLLKWAWSKYPAVRASSDQ